MELTNIPAQMSLFLSTIMGSCGSNSMFNFEELLLSYDDTETAFEFAIKGGGCTILWDMNVMSQYPKLCTFTEKSNVSIFYNLTFTYFKNDSIGYEVHCPDLILFTGKKNFSHAIKNAKDYGKRCAEFEIRHHLIFKDWGLYNESQAYPLFSPHIKDILSKLSRAKKDPTFDYPYWRLKTDIFLLKEEVSKYNLKTTFIDELLKESGLQPNDGTLLWYYSNYLGFTLQWTAINGFLLIIVILIIILYKHQRFINYKLYISKLPIAVVISTLNGWIFLSKPENINFIYWILPGILFVVTIFVAFYYLKSNLIGE